LKHLVVALAGFGAGWSAHQIWTRLNAPLPDSPVVRPIEDDGAVVIRNGRGDVVYYQKAYG
jgi:hypothetical protein